MEIIKKHLTNGQYLSSEDEKKSIILHHTAGLSADSAIRWWNTTPERVGTPYIIDRDGTIYECYEPQYWAYHLGIVGDDNWNEMHSIPIELVAAGFLQKEDEEFKFYPLWPNKFRPTIIPKEEVAELKKDFKGNKYYHKYTDAQIKSTVWLIKYLKELFPTLVLDNDLTDFMNYDPNVVKNHIPGIWSHSTVNVHSTDIYPSEPLIKALKEMQDTFKPVAKVIPKQTK